MKVLYITANPKEEQYSHSLSVGSTFIKEYKRINSDDEVVHVDLFKKDVPNIDYDVMGAWGKLQQGEDFSNLSEVQQQKLQAMNENLEEFMEADKYVFVSPLWNFGVPAVLKSYIDNILISGKTFKYTDKGPVGLLESKKSLFIQASGGVYNNEQMKAYEHGSNFMKVPLNFIGITNQSELLIEGVNMVDDGGVKIREESMKNAIEIASTF